MSRISVAEQATKAGERINVVIMASAGTGKTHQLSNRYLKLLLDGESPERILATTFTRKAAGEIFDRVVERLVQACLNDESRIDLGQDLHTPELTRERCLSVLAQLSRQLHRTRVDTLDAFFAEVARCFALEMQLPSAWRIVEEGENERIKARAVDRLLDETEIQAAQQMVHWIVGTTSSRYVATTLLKEIDAAHELFIESQEVGEKAWNFLKVSPEPTPLALAAAMDYLESLRTSYSSFIAGIDPVLRELREGRWKHAMGLALLKNAVPGGKYRNKDIPPELLDATATLRNFTVTHLRNGIAYRTSAAYKLVRSFHEHYWDLKRELVRFDLKMSRTALATLEYSGQSQRLAYRLDGWIDHLLLDEFQDTSPMQWLVIKGLATRIAEHNGSERTLFCVGDVKQAIYGFRGGTSSILQALASGNELPNLQLENLNVSYRSDQCVIELVNETFPKLHRHDNLGDALRRQTCLWQAEFPQHETVHEQPGYACLQTSAEITEEEKAAGLSQQQVTLREAARLVAALHRQTPQLSCVVLVQTNKAVALVIDELLRLEVNASAEGGNPLTDSAAVRVMLSALDLAEHPADTAAAFHVAHSSLGVQIGIPDDKYQDRELLVDVAERTRRALLTRGYGDLMAEWANALRSDCTRREWYRVQQFLDLAYGYGDGVTTRPIDFVKHIESLKKADPTASNVQVMTVHQSKGLGFDRVVVTELDGTENHPPSFSYDRDPVSHKTAHVLRYVGENERLALPSDVARILTADDLRRAEDTLCDLYVALTRAKHELRLVVSPSGHELAGKLKMPKSSAGLLRSALTETGAAPATTVLCAFGEPDWHKQPEFPDAKSQKQPRRPQLNFLPSGNTLHTEAPSKHRSDRLPGIVFKQAFDFERARSDAVRYVDARLVRGD